MEDIRIQGYNSTEIEPITFKRCRLSRRQTVQSNKKLCAKEERNASLKKVCSC